MRAGERGVVLYTHTHPLLACSGPVLENPIGGRVLFLFCWRARACCWRTKVEAGWQEEIASSCCWAGLHRRAWEACSMLLLVLIR